MFYYSTTVPEIHQHVFMPIARQVASKLLHDTGVRECIGDKIELHSDYYANSASKDKKTNLPILHHDAFQANVTANMDPKNLKWETLTPSQMDGLRFFQDSNNMSYPIFVDNYARISIFEKTMPCIIEMDCKVNFTDKNVAHNFMDTFFATYNNGTTMMVSDLTYDYPIPKTIIERLEVLAGLLDIEPEQRYEWYQDLSKKRIQKIVNKAQTFEEFVIKQHKLNCLVSFEYDFTTEVEKDGKSANIVAVPFKLTLQFSRPCVVHLRCPIVVNNKAVDASMGGLPITNPEFSPIPYVAMDNVYLDPFYNDNKQLTRDPVRMPWYDTWLVPERSLHSIKKAVPFFIAATTLDRKACDCGEDATECGPYCTASWTCVDLNDLGEFQLIDEVIADLQDETCFDVQSDRFCCAVYADNTQVSRSMLQMDNGKLYISNTLSDMFIYRVVLFAVPELSKANDFNWFTNSFIFSINAKEETK